MGSLKSPDGVDIPLDASLLIGRHPRCDVVVSDARASGEHAVLRWTGTRWTLRDLASRNGTFLEGRRLDAGTSTVLEEGACVAFGDRGSVWTLVSAGPPTARASTADGRTILAEDGLLALPSPQDPQVTLYSSLTGGWVSEEGGRRRDIVSGGEVTVDGELWQLHLPASMPETVGVGVALPSVEVVFQVSLDEEHVTVSLEHSGEVLELGSRAHDYMLLTLARLRASDADVQESEQGWVEIDDLQRMLRLDRSALNVAVYRARGHWTKAGVIGAAEVVGVRGTKRRFGVRPERVRVTRAS